MTVEVQRVEASTGSPRQVRKCARETMIQLSLPSAPDCLRSHLSRLRVGAATALLLGSVLTSIATAREPREHTSASAPSFDHEVMAVLSRVGCNLGTCHGNLNGKGDLRLSLRGQDPWQDYLALTHELGGRRLNRQMPEQSLMLLKPTSEVPHLGGQRLLPGSDEYRILLDWIRAGAPGPAAEIAQLRDLVVHPVGLVVRTPEQIVQLQVMAHFDDGSQRDVTQLSSFETSNYVAVVTPEGELRAQKPGELSVAVRYLNQQRSVRVAFVSQPGNAQPPGDGDWAQEQRSTRGLTPEGQTAHWIDQFIRAKQQALGLPATQQADDATFLRRAYLDTLGQLPTADEARSFAKDPDPAKRIKLIDHLLARPEYADHWALKWSDLLRNEEKLLDAEGVKHFHAWIREAFAQNMGLDVFVRSLVTGQGSTYEHPPANFYRALRDPQTRGEAAARLFLGIRLQCAQCHNHPFDHWTQDDYYDWASVFARIDYEIIENNRKDKFDKQEFVGDQRVFQKDEGEVRNPRTGADATPRFLSAETRRLRPETDRLEQLAQWLTAPDNRAFAEAQTNRIWYHLLGRGLVNPLDDFRVTNPASHPELLAALSQEFIASGFDVKHLVREIMLSQTYQAMPLQDDTDTLAADNYVGREPKRLTAEQLLDAQCQVLNVATHFNGYPTGTRAREVAGVQRVRPREQAPSDDDRFLTLFGKPPRLMNCECERAEDTTLSQAFNLINGPGLQRRLGDPDNRLGSWIAQNRSDEEMVNELFWTALGRAPREREQQAALAHLRDHANRRAALEDLAWAVLNAKEFLFRQ